MKIPHVEVIACTQFFGVPESLLGGGIQIYKPEKVKKFAEQDQGTNCERLIECAGRTCYDSYGIGRSSEDYHQHIKEVGHGSVTEHASISFFLKTISRGLTHELVRHRPGIAISQRSTRYVNESESDWIHHPLISTTVEYFDQFDYGINSEVADNLRNSISKIEMEARNTYTLVASAAQEYLEKEKKVDKLTARKQARGAARGFLGNALETSMVWTANIRALRHCIEQRASKFADAEIRVCFNRIYEEAYFHFPQYLNDYVKEECDDGIGYHLSTPYRKL